MTRAGLRTLAVAATVLMAVVGTGFALQAASLGRPGRDPLLVLRAVAGLVQYHRSHSSMTINGRHMSAVCTQTWKRQRRNATVEFAGGPTLTETGVALRPERTLAVDEFALAGCPRPLAKWLAAQLNRGAPIEVSTALLDHRRVIALRFPASSPGLRIVISRTSALPLSLSLSGRGITGTSRIAFGRAAGFASLAKDSDT